MRHVRLRRSRHLRGDRRLVAVVCIVALAGCSSGGDDETTPSPVPVDTTVDTPVEAPAAASPTSTSAGTPATAAPSTDAGPSGDAPELEPADIAAITIVFELFFGGLDSTVDQKVAALEDGETYRTMLDAASANEQFQQMSTDVRDVRRGSDAECDGLGAAPGCAVVTHDLLVGGYPMAAAVESPAVQVGGSWMVGAQAWCNVVAIGGASCPDETQDTSTP